MSDSDNYFSEDEVDNNSVNTDMEEDEDFYSDEMDEEEREYYLQLQQKHMDKPIIDFSNFKTDKKTSPKKVKKVKKSINEITREFFENKEDEEKPKKWISKRLQDKKKELGVVIKKRQFNPRLPPPLKGQFDKKEIVLVEKSFPKL